MTWPDSVATLRNRDLQDSALAGLVGSLDVNVSVVLARRPFAPALPVLAKDADEEVRGAVAGQILTPVDVLRDLAGGALAGVREAVHRNEAPSDEVRALAGMRAFD